MSLSSCINPKAPWRELLPEGLLELARDVEVAVEDTFIDIDNRAGYLGEKVLYGFSQARVSEACLKGSTGYGYGDMGREVLDEVYRIVFDGEDALVRHNFVSGTHALTVALFGVLRPGDKLVSVAGRPYDTLTEVIGIKDNDSIESPEYNPGSLVDFGIEYNQVELNEDGSLDFVSIEREAKGAKVIYLQRSRGYSLRPAITISQIEELSRLVKRVNSGAILVVDNCYGEFVEDCEPTAVGSDLIVGSLIKNAGGGIAETGGYIVGRKDLVELCSYRLTAVGMGKEVGCSLNQTKGMLQGFFLAPEVTANALKTAVFGAELFRRLGFESLPSSGEKRSDIITVIKLRDERNLVAFCKGIQKGAPIDSFVTPEPWEMPGYSSKVIMAAGAFVGGASIELSADAPIRPPYAAWLQGGLTYPSGRFGLLLAAGEMVKEGLIRL